MDQQRIDAAIAGGAESPKSLLVVHRSQRSFPGLAAHSIGRVKDRILPDASKPRKLVLILCQNVSSIIQQASVIESSTKLVCEKLFTSKGPILSRPTWKSILSRASVLIATPRSALNALEHGFLPPSSIQMVIIHNAESIYPLSGSNPLSRLYREWFAGLTDVLKIGFASKYNLSSKGLVPASSPNASDAATAAGEKSASKSLVKYLDFSSRIFRTKFQAIESDACMLVSAPKTARPLLRRIGSAIFDAAKFWGSDAAQMLLDRFKARILDERECTKISAEAPMRHDAARVLGELEAFSGAIEQLLNKLNQDNSNHGSKNGSTDASCSSLSSPCDQIVKSVQSTLANDTTGRNVLIVTGRRVYCDIIEWSLRQQESANQLPILNLGSNRGRVGFAQSVKKEESLLAKFLSTPSKKGSSYPTITIATPDSIQGLISPYKHDSGAPSKLSVLWADPEVPSVASAGAIMDICTTLGADSMQIMLDWSHKRSKIFARALDRLQTLTLSAEDAPTLEKKTFESSESQPVMPVLTRKNHGVKIGPASSTDLFFRWLSTMPHDVFWRPTCSVTYQRVPVEVPIPIQNGSSKVLKKVHYQCTLSKFPAWAPFTTASIVGEVAPTKRLAKQSVCAVALRELDRLSQFDFLCRPAHYRNMREHLSEDPASTCDFDKKKNREYPTTLPEVWPRHDAEKEAASESGKLRAYLYRVNIEGVSAAKSPTTSSSEVGIVRLGSPFLDDENRHFAPFEIVDTAASASASASSSSSSAPLMRLVTVTFANEISLTESELERLKKFHLAIFRQLLPQLALSLEKGLVPQWHEGGSEDPRSYLIAPIRQKSSPNPDGQSFEILWSGTSTNWDPAFAESNELDLDSLEKIEWDNPDRAQVDALVSDSILVSMTNRQVYAGVEVDWDLHPDSPWPFKVQFTTFVSPTSDPAEAPTNRSIDTPTTPTSAPLDVQRQLDFSSPTTGAKKDSSAPDESTSHVIPADAIKTPVGSPTKPDAPPVTPGSASKRFAANGVYYTFRDHFRDRWGLMLGDERQPLLKAKNFTFRAVNALLAPVAASSKESIPTPVKSTPTTTPALIQLAPAICRRHPLSLSVFRFLRFMPSVLIRLESLQRAHRLAFDVIGLPYEPETAPALTMLILEALTSPTCCEFVDFEQLETVGDCFLKFTACLDTFFRFPKFHEFQLEVVKHHFVSNRTLFEKSVKWNLGSYLMTRHCKPENWTPPGFASSSTTPLKHTVNDKRISDIFEALLGACYRHGGPELALKYLAAAGFNDIITRAPQDQDGVSSDSTSDQSISQALESLNLVDHVSATDLAGLEERLGYKFRSKLRFIRALVHPSMNKLGSFASRCKFLGDSIIDMYTLDRWMEIGSSSTVARKLSPGVITDLRAATVMGTSEAAVAVMMGLHRCLIYQSPRLAEHLKEYVERMIRPEAVRNAEYSFADIAASDAPEPLAASFEALLGAVYFDSNQSLDAVFDVLDVCLKKPFLDVYVDLENSQLTLAPARLLSETAATRWCRQVTKVERQLRLFEFGQCDIFIHKEMTARCFASQKKEAGKKAAKEAFDFTAQRDGWWDGVCDCPRPKSAPPRSGPSPVTSPVKLDPN